MSLVRACYSAFLIQMKMRVVDPMAYAGLLIFPLAMTVVGFFVLRSGGHQGNDAYAIFGGALTGFWSYTFFDAGNSIHQERWTGTLEQIMACPTPVSVIVLGKVISAMAVALLGFIPVVVVGYLIGARLSAPDPALLALALLVTTLAFFGVGMLLAPLYVLARWIFPIINGLEIFIYVICGFMFPVQGLPVWMQQVATVLPPSWAVRALYESLGAAHGDVVVPLLLATGLTIVCLALSGLLFRWVQTRARVSGQLATQ